jgi:hypothetical protein
VIDYLAPVRERYEQLRADEASSRRSSRRRRAARAIAAQTLADVRERMGVGARNGEPARPPVGPRPVGAGRYGERMSREE